MLKLKVKESLWLMLNQPPSGGCVLKRAMCETTHDTTDPAAFGRLCVETVPNTRWRAMQVAQPPSGGCVLKPLSAQAALADGASRLRAAVC